MLVYTKPGPSGLTIHTLASSLLNYRGNQHGSYCRGYYSYANLRRPPAGSRSSDDYYDGDVPGDRTRKVELSDRAVGFRRYAACHRSPLNYSKPTGSPGVGRDTAPPLLASA